MDPIGDKVGRGRGESPALKRGRGSSDETVSGVEVEVEHGPAVTELEFELKPANNKVTDEVRSNDLLSSRDRMIATLKDDIEALEKENEALKKENEELKGGQEGPNSQATLPSQDEDHHEEQAQRLAEDQWRTLDLRLREENHNHAATSVKLEAAVKDNERLRADALHLTEKTIQRDEEVNALRLQVRELQDANQAQARQSNAFKQGLRKMLEDASATENRSGGHNCSRRAQLQPPC